MHTTAEDAEIFAALIKGELDPKLAAYVRASIPRPVHTFETSVANVADSASTYAVVLVGIDSMVISQLPPKCWIADDGFEIKLHSIVNYGDAAGVERLMAAHQRGVLDRLRPTIRAVGDWEQGVTPYRVLTPEVWRSARLTMSALGLTERNEGALSMSGACRNFINSTIEADPDLGIFWADSEHARAMAADGRSPFQDPDSPASELERMVLDVCTGVFNRRGTTLVERRRHWARKRAPVQSAPIALDSIALDSTALDEVQP